MIVMTFNQRNKVNEVVGRNINFVFLNNLGETRIDKIQWRIHYLEHNAWVS